MERVGLATTRPSYEGLRAPWRPGPVPPELESLLGTGSPGALNHVHTAVRDALRALGLDATRRDRADWNPLSELAAPGSCIVLKPNFIRHWNPRRDASVASVITHGAVLRAMLDYAFLAAGPEGRVIVAEAPQHDCDWSEIERIVGLPELVDHYAERGLRLEVVDLRREFVRYEDAVIVSRHPLPGDPAGYRLIDLGRHSWFTDSGLDPRRFRGADYDPGPTTEHHSGGRNEYLLSETVLSADLVVNLPKLKTHKKTGVTLALKNLVGINGDKNLLPHHCVGPVSAGGDEFPGDSWLDLARSRATELGRKLLARGVGTRLLRAVRRAESQARGDDFIRSGNWHGNRTTWRMCLDLNRCLYYSDAHGEYFDAEEPVRRVLTVCDGIVAGEGEGPLAPGDRPLGVVLASLDPLALDVVAVALMGFDAANLPKLEQAMADTGLRVTRVHGASEVELFAVDSPGALPAPREIEALRPQHPFDAHPGWRGSIEKRTP